MKTGSQFGRRKAVAVGVAAAVPVAAWGAWAAGGTDLLLAVVLVTLVAGFAALAMFISRIEQRREQSRRTMATPALDEMSDRELLELVLRRLDAVENRLDHPGEHAEQLLRAVDARHRRLEIAQVEAIESFLARLAPEGSATDDEEG